MFKLIKYELRGTFLTIIATCITVIIANLLLMTRKNSWGVDLVAGLSICLIIGALIVIFISSLKIMSSYLHEDSGYLLFTLPKSGVSIITSRLITALIQMSLISFVSFLMFYLILAEQIDLSFFKYFTLSQILCCIIAYIWNIISLLTFIYFCMIIGKVALKGKKLGKIGSFIIFILISLGMAWLSTKITVLFPQTINLGGSSIANNFKTSNPNLSISGGTFNINIADSIFSIIVFVGFFISTSYLIDKKLDLS
jgi:ABC-2 type transport system permease protein